jgi:hypothetical protein
VYSPTATTKAGCEYNLASYLLTSSGGDAMTCRYLDAPNTWWSAYDVALGAPTGRRSITSAGVLRREFSHGLVLVNPPGRDPIAVSLPRAYTTTAGASVTAVTLAAGTGAVLVAR